MEEVANDRFKRRTLAFVLSSHCPALQGQARHSNVVETRRECSTLRTARSGQLVDSDLIENQISFFAPASTQALEDPLSRCFKYDISAADSSPSRKLG